MFDHAIFASFIPQILMLIGYLSCLLIPAYYKPQEQITDTPKVIVYYSPATKAGISAVSFSDYVQVADDISEKRQLYAPHVHTSKISFAEIFFEICQNKSFKLFSRPPPAVS